MRALRFIRVSKRGKTLLALSIVIFIYTFATSILQYNLVLFTDSLAANYTLFGFVMGLPWLFSLLTDMPTGALAERFGKKRTIVFGLLGLAASGLFFYFVSGLFQLFWGLVLFSVFEGFLTVAGMASVIAVSPHRKEHQYVGGYSSASALGYVVGPLAGGLAVALTGNRIPFLVFAIICGVAALVAAVIVPPPRHRHETLGEAVSDILWKDHVYTGELQEFFSAGRLSLFVVVSMFLSGMWFEFIWALEPIFVDAIAISPAVGGIILSSFSVPFVFLDYPLGRWLDRSQKRFLSISIGLALGGISMAAFSVVAEPVLLGILAALTSAGLAFYYVAANGIFDSLSDHHRRGYMTGVWQSAEDIGFVVGPVFGGVAADLFGLRGAFLSFSGLVILMFLFALVMRRDIRRYEARTA